MKHFANFKRIVGLLTAKETRVLHVLAEELDGTLRKTTRTSIKQTNTPTNLQNRVAVWKSGLNKTLKILVRDP